MCWPSSPRARALSGATRSGRSAAPRGAPPGGWRRLPRRTSRSRPTRRGRPPSSRAAQRRQRAGWSGSTPAALRELDDPHSDRGPGEHTRLGVNPTAKRPGRPVGRRPPLAAVGIPASGTSARHGTEALQAVDVCLVAAAGGGRGAVGLDGARPRRSPPPTQAPVPQGGGAGHVGRQWRKAAQREAEREGWSCRSAGGPW